MMRSSNCIGRIIDDQWGAILKLNNSWKTRTLSALRVCRTASLGGKIYECNSCKKLQVRYYSCRNRHCPRCQNTQKEQWINARKAQLIPTHYFHMVFTLPHELNELCMVYPRQLYKLLFQVSWATINTFGWDSKYLGAQTGATMVLHTWGSNLSFHPHVHCMVPGGGISYNNKWKQGKGKGKFLFPVKAMSEVFKGKFIAALIQLLHNLGLEPTSFPIEQLNKKKWVVYAKPPFKGVEGAIQYLARYTHKIAITNHRIIDYDANHVEFKYKDYRQQGKQKTMRLAAREFVRRFAIHILPRGFPRIRHYGILSSAWKNQLFGEQLTQEVETWEQIWWTKGLDVYQCQHCPKGRLEFREELDRYRAPP